MQVESLILSSKDILALDVKLQNIITEKRPNIIRKKRPIKIFMVLYLGDAFNMIVSLESLLSINGILQRDRKMETWAVACVRKISKGNKSKFDMNKDKMSNTTKKTRIEGNK